MGSTQSKPYVNKFSDKCIISGRCKEDVINALQKFATKRHPTFICIRYGMHFVMKDENAKKVKKTTKVTNYSIGAVASIPAISTGAEIGTGIGALTAGPFGAGLGFVIGSAVGAVGTAAITKNAHKAEMEKFESISWHHFIVIEYGNKLKTKIDGFEYEYFLRIEFSNHGYSVCIDKTYKFWHIFEEEKRIKRAHLKDSVECNGNIYTLMAAIKETESQYNVVTSNCQHFAKHIWKQMVSMDNI